MSTSTAGVRRPRLTVAPAAAAVAAPLGLAAVIVASAWLRSRAIGAAYWMDEGISVGIASHPLTAIPGLLREDGSPPLFYLLLHAWMWMAGRSEAATHALSVLAAVACVPVAWWLARTLWGRRAGWAAGLLAAVSPPLTYHAQETRMYPLVVLEALLVAGSFVACFLQGRERWAWLHAAALTALAYTHNWFVFLAVAEGVVVVLLVAIGRGRRRALLRRAAIAFGLPLLLYLPWVPTLLFQARHTGAPWSAAPTLLAVWRVRLWLLEGPVALAALGIAVLSGAVTLARPRHREWEQLLTLGWLTGATLGLAFAANRITPAWAERYTLILLGPLVLLAALASARIGAAGPIAVAVVLVAWFHQPPYDTIANKSNVRSLTARLEPHVHRGDLVLDVVPETVPVVRFYLGPHLHYATQLGPVHDPQVMDWRDALARLRAVRMGAVVHRIDRLPVGTRVAFVRPILRAPSSDAWKETIREQAIVLHRLLHRDPALHLRARVPAGARDPKTTLRALVYARVSGSGRGGSPRSAARGRP